MRGDGGREPSGKFCLSLLRSMEDRRSNAAALDANPKTQPPRMADDDRKRKGEQGGPGTAVITKTKPQTKRPNLYRVLLLNDDYTPMEFVVHVLERFFNKDPRRRTGS